jgi:FlaA1/EpsC-like NDP-sugar epimerase
MKRKIKVIIVGAGGAGAYIARAIKENDVNYEAVAFVDDDISRQGQEVLGVPVLGTRNSIPDLVKKYEIEEVIIAIPSASPRVIREIMTICQGTGVKVKIIPGIKKILSGHWSVHEIRELAVEDLLHRETVETDLEPAQSFLKDKTILVTGAGGSIGSEICRQVACFNVKKIVLLGHGENSIFDIFRELKDIFPQLALEPVIGDIQDREKMKLVFARFRPEIVFHAAAHKHVPFMEIQPEEAWKNNVLGTKNVAEVALGVSETFVFISTDKAVNPVNVLGGTKKIGELLVRAMNELGSTKFAVVRFGNVLGSRGSVVPLFKRQIAAGGPVTITHPEMKRYMMTIPEAVQLVIQAGVKAQGGEIFVLDMGKPIKIMDLARDLIYLSGLEPGKDIEIKVVGMRPGEKLGEELLTGEESIHAQKLNKMLVVPREVPDTNLINQLNQILSLKPANGGETIKIMKSLLPDFPYVY